jgi:hypothetical protein
MDAKEFFRIVVAENCKEAGADPTNFRKLWNAAVSINTVAEYLALDRAGYPTLKGGEVDKKAQAIREQIPELKAIKPHVDMLKHVRKHEGQEVSASSTGILPQDPNSFADLRNQVEGTFATLSSSVPEFK